MSLNTTPRTWVSGEVVTAAEMNAEIRDALTGIQAAWTSFTPSLVAVTTNPTLGTGGSSVGNQLRVGADVRFRITITWGGAGLNVGSGIYSLTLPGSSPATPQAINSSVAVRQAATGNNWLGVGQIVTPGNQARLSFNATGANPYLTNGAPIAWAVNDIIQLAADMEG